MSNPEDRQYLIDFSSVRGGDIVQEIHRAIALVSPDRPTAQLFTGHVGSGKSTELLRLKASLEQARFHVVYFQSDQDLEMGNVEVTNVLMAITRRVSQSLEDIGIRLRPSYFQRLLQDLAQVFQHPIDLSEVSFSVGMASVTAEARESPERLSQLQQYLEPRTRSIIDAINTELLQPATERLAIQGKRGLAVIVDNLDRMDTLRRNGNRLQSEYLFVGRGEQLKGLACHVVYTIPLELVFSDELPQLINRFGNRPQVLPMVPVQNQAGDRYEPGMALLRQMALARAFPELPPVERLNRVEAVFEDLATLDRLCYISGGHMRNLMRLMYGCLLKQDPTFSRDTLESVIRNERDDLASLIDDQEWRLLLEAAARGRVQSDEDYNVLLRSLYLFEYRAPERRWFGINPVLKETETYQRLTGPSSNGDP
ncbi:KAP family P-loop domain-containing protein [filamentous cyanobacterium CCP5]|nr:KAP family P-loop domain-containing protein [filamentous cyanobacterium CCP5]